MNYPVPAIMSQIDGLPLPAVYPIADAVAASSPPKNIWRHTEDMTTGDYSDDWTAQIYNGVGTNPALDTIKWQGITLTRVGCNNLGEGVFSYFSNIGFSNLTLGGYYFLSFFVRCAPDSWSGDGFLWALPPVSYNSPAHGASLIDQSVRRVWCLVRATSSSEVDQLADGTIALGSGAGGEPRWLRSMINDALGVSTALKIYVGGFQVEPVSNPGKYGILWCGDSTTASRAADGTWLQPDGYDLPGDRNAPRWTGALLNVPNFNRGVGGRKLCDMMNLPNDYVPWAVNSKYFVVPGGLNDIFNSRTLAQIQQATENMEIMAEQNGMIYVPCTITPSVALTDGTYPGGETMRQDFNNWLRAEKGFDGVLDFDAVVRDPSNPELVNQDSTLVGDGTHFSWIMSRRIGWYAANCVKDNRWGLPRIFEFPRPGPYQPVLGV